MSNKNKLKKLQERFKRLKDPNNSFNVIYSIEDIGNKSEQLLSLHTLYKKEKKLDRDRNKIKMLLKKLLYDYETLIDSMEIYEHISHIRGLKKSLIKNLNDLRDKDVTMYLYENSPSMHHLVNRFNKLSRYANQIRKKKKTKRKWLR